MTLTDLTYRNGDLQTVVAALRQRRDLALDQVVPAASMAMTEMGQLSIVEAVAEGVEPFLTEHDLTRLAEGQLAGITGVPVAYWRRMAEGHGDLLATNANHWLGRMRTSHLVRSLRSADGEGAPLVRAVLSDRYRVIDDFDVLLSALAGIRDAGVDAHVGGVDLTERRMIARIEAPEVQVAAPELLEMYRDPRTGRSGRDYPIVHAGLVITNSEVGEGAVTIAPRIVLQVCTNGMTRAADTVRNVHLGQRLDEGIVRWSEEAHQVTLDLIKVKARDAVATFLDVEYLRSAVAELAAAQGVRLADPAGVIHQVAQRHLFNQEQEAAILGAFIAGGDVTPFGVAQAITSVSQGIEDGDAAHDLEQAAWGAMVTAAAVA